jgi:hypothetical protein
MILFLELPKARIIVCPKLMALLNVESRFTRALTTT